MYDRLTDANDGNPLPEFRLPTLFVTSWFVPISLFWYGWSAQAGIHWIMPVIGTFWFGIAVVNVLVSLSNYLVDGFKYAASALAAATVLRSVFGLLNCDVNLNPLVLHSHCLAIRCLLSWGMVGVARYLDFWLLGLVSRFLSLYIG